MEKAPIETIIWWKAATTTSAFTFKNIFRHYGYEAIILGSIVSYSNLIFASATQFNIYLLTMS